MTNKSSDTQHQSDNATDAAEVVDTVTSSETEIPTVITQPSVQALETVQNAESAASLQEAINAVELALNLTSYNTLSPEDQTAVAQALLSDLSKVDYADTAALQQTLNKAVADQRDAAALRNAIAAVNSAGDASQMQGALEGPYLGLVLMNYRNLSADGKLEAAEALNKAVPTGGFVSRADIQEAFNEAVASVLQTEGK